jgi:hypothetical protein
VLAGTIAATMAMATVKPATPRGSHHVNVLIMIQPLGRLKSTSFEGPPIGKTDSYVRCFIASVPSLVRMYNGPLPTYRHLRECSRNIGRSFLFHLAQDFGEIAIRITFFHR